MQLPLNLINPKPNNLPLPLNPKPGPQPIDVGLSVRLWKCEASAPPTLNPNLGAECPIPKKLNFSIMVGLYRGYLLSY